MWSNDYKKVGEVAQNVKKWYAFEKVRAFMGIFVIFLGLAYGERIAKLMSGGFNQSVVDIDPALTRGLTISLVVLGGYFIVVDLIRRMKA